MLKVLKIGLFSLFFSTLVLAKPYVLENQNQLLEKTVGFMEILSDEVFEKTGVSLYVVTLKSLDGMDIHDKEQSYLKQIKSPYVLLFFTLLEKKINIITDQATEQMFDKQEVYWNYIVPLIPKNDKELTQQSISAFLLNGFVDIADRIADFHQVDLEHSFPKKNTGVEVAVRAILYGMIFVLLVLFVFVYLRRKT